MAAMSTRSHRFTKLSRVSVLMVSCMTRFKTQRRCQLCHYMFVEMDYDQYWHVWNNHTARMKIVLIIDRSCYISQSNRCWNEGDWAFSGLYETWRYPDYGIWTARYYIYIQFNKRLEALLIESRHGQEFPESWLAGGNKSIRNAAFWLRRFRTALRLFFNGGSTIKYRTRRFQTLAAEKI